jgi:hypothetical protein
MKELAMSWRIPTGALINCVSWVALATLLIIPVRLAWPDYAAAESARAFDLSMLIARLSVSAFASVAAGAIAGLTVRDHRIAPLAGGLLMLGLSVPHHIEIWDQYPVWYHLTFFLSLPLLAWGGGRLSR